jgi:hypothetical protein
LYQARQTPSLSLLVHVSALAALLTALLLSLLAAFLLALLTALLLARLALLVLLLPLLAALTALATLLARALALLALLAALSLLAALARTIHFISHRKSPVWVDRGFSPPGQNLPAQDWFRLSGPQIAVPSGWNFVAGRGGFSRKIVFKRQRSRNEQKELEWGK